MQPNIQARRSIYQGKIVSVEIQTIQLADGRTAQNEVVLHRPCVAMVVVDADGRLVLVRQFRSPAEAELLEIPAGSVDDGEEIEAAVQRELQEEVGVKAARAVRLGGIYVAPGYCTEYIHLYQCQELMDSRLPADEDELIQTERLTLRQALNSIASGRIQDAKSVAGLLLYAQTQAAP
jgi:ADP-ribose pyrophosphatase